jgi:hypothetical protein
MANKNPKGLPKTADGKIKAGPGRGKGTPNKVTREAKEMIALAFEGAGGLPALIRWAKKKPDLFYSQLYTKLIPVTVAGTVNAKIEDGNGQLLASRMVDALCRIQAARESGVRSTAVIIDNDAIEEPIPQLVVSSKTGTKAA